MIARATCKFLGVEYGEPVESPTPEAAQDSPTQEELDYLAQLLADTRRELAAERTARAAVEDRAAEAEKITARANARPDPNQN